MQEKIERLIKLVYKNWKIRQTAGLVDHPDEEAMACFLENKLSGPERQQIEAHLARCDKCAEAFFIQAKLSPEKDQPVPEEVMARVKNLVSPAQGSSFLEIALQFKQKLLEIISTTGDVLVGQELVPAPLLRSRKIKDFKDEVIIFKDFENIRVEAKIENEGAGKFSLAISIRKKDNLEFIKDLRVTLLKGDRELESYVTSSGRASFEHMLLGKYTVEISSVDNKIASVLLDIKT